MDCVTQVTDLCPSRSELERLRGDYESRLSTREEGEEERRREAEERQRAELEGVETAVR